VSLAAPFPYFGGKRRAAPIVWRRLGDPSGYVEPFAGSAAVLHAERRAATDHAGEVRPQSTIPAGAGGHLTSPACLPCAAKDRRVADLEAELRAVRTHRHRIEDDRIDLIRASAAADPGPAPMSEGD